MARFFEDPAFEPGFDVLWDRLSMTSLPSREHNERIALWLRDRPRVGRVALLVDPSMPTAYRIARMFGLLGDP